MNDEQTIEALRTAMAAEVRGHRLDAATVLGGITEAAPRARRRTAEYVAVAACLAGALALALIYAITKGDDPKGTAASSESLDCGRSVVTATLPEWARAGFSPDSYVNAYATGVHDRIVAVLFATPLRSPPDAARANKILWVARDHGTGPLTIAASLDGSTTTKTRSVPGGPGPSIIDLPAPGCWRLTLTWSGHRDELALPYSGR